MYKIYTDILKKKREIYYAGEVFYNANTKNKIIIILIFFNKKFDFIMMNVMI